MASQLFYRFLYTKGMSMYIETRKNKNGNEYYVAVDRYRDPLTGTLKRASVSFKVDSVQARRQAVRELEEKIEKIIDDIEKQFKSETITTFGELKCKWFDDWSTTVKESTINREILVLERLSEMIPDKILLKIITPLFIKNCLVEYKNKYKASHSTLQHIKCTLNKMFDYGVLHNIIQISPSRVIRLNASVDDKIQRRNRSEAKFLKEIEVQVLFTELNNCRNKSYLDLAIFLVGTGCRIGEASALRISDFDFEKQTVEISKSLQSNNLKVIDFYDDSTKTVAGEREILLPNFVVDAVKRVIIRNNDLQDRITESASKAFWETDYLFKTEYGSPITSHSFREVLTRINNSLKNNCEEKYGFKWTKNAVPHSFRHIHISALRNNANVSLKEVQSRVGHVEAETTNGYTHLESESQEKSVQAITDFFKQIDFAQ